MTIKHTPLPKVFFCGNALMAQRTDPNGVGFSEHLAVITEASPELRKQICHLFNANNSHYELLEALKNTRSVLAELHYAGPVDDSVMIDSVDETIKKAEGNDNDQD